MTTQKLHCGAGLGPRARKPPKASWASLAAPPTMMASRRDRRRRRWRAASRALRRTGPASTSSASPAARRRWTKMTTSASRARWQVCMCACVRLVCAMRCRADDRNRSTKPTPPQTPPPSTIAAPSGWPGRRCEQCGRAGGSCGAPPPSRHRRDQRLTNRSKSDIVTAVLHGP